MVEMSGLVLSSHSVRCRDADSLAFGSVRLFKSCKICTTGIFYTIWIKHPLPYSVNLLVEMSGLVLSSHSVRCRDADSLAFGSVRLFKSCKICTTGIFYTIWIKHPLPYSVNLLVEMSGLEPLPSCLPDKRSPTELHPHFLEYYCLNNKN